MHIINQELPNQDHRLRVVVQEMRASVISCCESEPEHQDDLMGLIHTLIDQLDQGDDNAILIKVAEIKSKLGDLSYRRQEYKIAYKNYEESFKILRSITPDISTCQYDAIVSAYHAGKCLHSLGKIDQAICLYDIFFDAVLSPNISIPDLIAEDTVLKMNSIAWAFYQQLLSKHASKFYKKTIKAASYLVGENTKIFARILNQYGNLMFESKNFFSSLRYFKRSFMIQRTIILNQNPIDFDVQYFIDSLTTMSNIALTLEYIGEVEKTLLSYREILQFLTFGSNHFPALPSSTVNKHMEIILLNVSRIQDKLGNCDQALEALSNVLKIKIQEYGQYHSSVGSTLNDIGIIHGRLGHTSLALQHFEKSLRIRVLAHNPDQSLISTVLFNIALVYMRNGEHVKALRYLKELVKNELSKRGAASSFQASSKLQLATKVPPAEVVFDGLELMAQIYNDDLNEPFQALCCFESGIRMIMEYGPELSLSPDLQSRYFGMAGNACLRLGKMKEAIHFFAEAIRVNEAVGLAFYTNIKADGYDIRKLEHRYLPAAAAA